jgi:chaperonin GroEL|tara:strand:- start:167 stop:1711 length:1545 start_codon:yes stop_codon:yes gene_type:complete
MEELKLVKNLAFGELAKGQVLTGVTKLTNAVGSTLGASGKCVIIEDTNGKPQVTKDGVTVANSITLREPLENIGASLIKEAAQMTVKEAGDGTTTATVLAQAILEEADKHDQLDSLRNIKEGINTGLEKVLKYLDKKSKKISGKKIDQVASISANNDYKLGKIIGEAFRMVDETGLVIMETNEKPETVVELVEGVEYEQGLKSNHFINNKEKGTAELDNPLVLIVESKIENIRKIQGVLEYIIKNNKSLLIIADVEQQVVNALAMNKVKGNIKVNILDAPIYGLSKKDTLSDLCDLTGATLINEGLGDDMDLIQPEHLGTCEKSITSSNSTVFKVNTEGNEAVADTIKMLEAKIKKATGGIKDRIEKRLSKLKGKVAIVKVGASSEVELKEKRDRVEDAICATKAAIKEGIVSGGGIALLNAHQNLNPLNVGEEVLYQAILKPYQIILKNAGVEDYEMPHVEGQGLDVVTGKTVNMVKAGIIDPLLVTKSALKNAASVATTIMSTDCVINNIRV